MHRHCQAVSVASTVDVQECVCIHLPLQLPTAVTHLSCRMQTNSKELQQVLDIVVSHQALQLKCGLVVRLLYALVTPRPERYRPLLRRLAALVGKQLPPAQLLSCSKLSLAVVKMNSL